MADTHRINFEPVDIEMEVDEEETVLDAAFRQGIHLMHGCREGRCSACKSYVLDGEIQMEDYSTFACNDAEADEGYVLLCRSHVFSDCTIELLNFDEDELLGGIADPGCAHPGRRDRIDDEGHRLAAAPGGRRRTSSNRASIRTCRFQAPRSTGPSRWRRHNRRPSRSSS